MRALLVEDDRFTRASLETMLSHCGLEVSSCASGTEALKVVVREKPDLIITDWMMPEMDGISLARRIRALDETAYTYVVMITAKNRKEDMVMAMDAGVDDFLGKPFHREELKVRLRAAERILSLQRSLAKRVRELETANSHVRRLQGFLPICAYCKSVRNDEDFWQNLEHYLSEKADELILSHSVCPECHEKHVKPMETRYYGTPMAPVARSAAMLTEV